jgi:hypothetical protein
MRSSWLWLVFAAQMGCGSTIQVGNSGDGGTASGADGSGGSGSEAGALSQTAASSPYLKKCTEACVAPSTGPCAAQDATACINTCTAYVDGLSVGCAQCLVENSGYAGAKCATVGAPGDPIEFGPGIGGTDSACPEGATCATCSSMCPCSAAKERCDGFKMAKTTASPCATSCSGAGTNACSGFGGGNSGGSGSCTGSTTWGCGSDNYSVECACPSRQCKCIKNGTTTTVVNYPYSCSDSSNCDKTLIPTAQCGFPMP